MPSFNIYKLHLVDILYCDLNVLILYLFVDITQAEFLLSGLQQLVEKQHAEHSQLQKELNIMHVQNNSKLSVFFLTIHETIP